MTLLFVCRILVEERLIMLPATVADLHLFDGTHAMITLAYSFSLHLIWQ